MSHIKKLEINNFRCFENFEISDFKAINLIVGKNNSGKTCLLESLFLIVGSTNPMLPDTINNIRGLDSSTTNLKYLFHNCNLTSFPLFTAKFDNNSESEITLSPTYSASNKEPFSFNSLSSATSQEIVGIELTLKIKNKPSPNKIIKNSYVISNQGEQRILSDYRNKMTAAFIPANALETRSALLGYGELVKKKKEAAVLKILQQIEPKILEIHALPDGLFFSYKDIDELIPCQIAGDGIRRIFNIITNIANETNNVILIDEIEAGLHYSAHSSLWKGIFSLCKALNVQLFITTHNIETLRSFKETLELEAYQELQNDVAVFDLVDTKKCGLKAYRSSFDGIKGAIELHQEIRV